MLYFKKYSFQLQTYYINKKLAASFFSNSKKDEGRLGTYLVNIAKNKWGIIENRK